MFVSINMVSGHYIEWIFFKQHALRILKTKKSKSLNKYAAKIIVGYVPYSFLIQRVLILDFLVSTALVP